MKSMKKKIVTKEIKATEPKKMVKKVVVKPSAKTTTREPKDIAQKELKTVIAQERVQTAEGWKRAMLLERKTVTSKKK